MLIAHWTDPYIPYSLTKPFHHSDAFNFGEVFKAIKEFFGSSPQCISTSQLYTSGVNQSRITVPFRSIRPSPVPGSGSLDEISSMSPVPRPCG